MNFQEFLNIIITSFNNFLSLVSNIFGKIINDNFVKFFIFLILLYFAINLLFKIVKLIFNIFSSKKENKKEKEKSTIE